MELTERLYRLSEIELTGVFDLEGKEMARQGENF